MTNRVITCANTVNVQYKFYVWKMERLAAAEIITECESLLILIKKPGNISVIMRGVTLNF